MANDFQLLIDGTDREGSGEWSEPVLNPATGESIGRVAYASDADLDEAVAAASRGMGAWRAVPPWERGGILKEAARIMRRDVDGAALTITREQGKPLGEAKEEVLRSADFLEWGGEQARRISDRVVPGRVAGDRIEIQTHPIGVVAGGRSPTPAGLRRSTGAAMKPVTMELGGHAPVIVCGDVDPERAADALARAKFANAGQISSSWRRRPARRADTCTGAPPHRTSWTRRPCCRSALGSNLSSGFSTRRSRRCAGWPPSIATRRWRAHPPPARPADHVRLQGGGVALRPPSPPRADQPAEGPRSGGGVLGRGGNAGVARDRGTGRAGGARAETRPGCARDHLAL